jgi:hypothetical protein
MYRGRSTYCLIILLLVLAGATSYAQDYPFKVERAPFSDRMYDEFAPVILNGNIVYRSNKPESVRSKKVDTKGETAMNIFISRNMGSGEWSDADLFSNELRGRDQHFGPATFNDRGNRIWFTMINEESGDKNSGRLGIYSGGFAGGEWTAIQPFEYNDPRYDFMHPILSGDGSMLFFTSNMRGGLGGFDLYVCYLRNSRWTEPVNLGPNINTNRDEIYPVFYPDGRLYFASRGQTPNLGGFDIYYSYRDAGSWSPPVHLDPPFNTRRHDAWFMLTDTSYTRGYIHSNREARIFNIFEFSLDIPDDLYENCKLIEKNSYCFTFYEAGTMDIDTTQFRYEWVIEGNKFRQEEVDYCFSGVGYYRIDLNVIDMLSGEVMFNEASYELDIEDIEQVYITSPDTVIVMEPVQFSSEGTYIKDYTTDRYVWNMGDHTWAAETRTEHRYFQPGTYTVKLGVMNAAEQPEQIQKTCGFKRVVVLPRGDGPASQLQ